MWGKLGRKPKGPRKARGRGRNSKNSGVFRQRPAAYTRSRGTHSAAWWGRGAREIPATPMHMCALLDKAPDARARDLAGLGLRAGQEEAVHRELDALSTSRREPRKAKHDGDSTPRPHFFLLRADRQDGSSTHFTRHMIPAATSINTVPAGGSEHEGVTTGHSPELRVCLLQPTTSNATAHGEFALAGGAGHGESNLVDKLGFYSCHPPRG